LRVEGPATRAATPTQAVVLAQAMPVIFTTPGPCTVSQVAPESDVTTGWAVPPAWHTAEVAQLTARK
jgi:hypothetical protein